VDCHFTGQSSGQPFASLGTEEPLHVAIFVAAKEKTLPPSGVAELSTLLMTRAVKPACSDDTEYGSAGGCR